MQTNARRLPFHQFSAWGKGEKEKLRSTGATARENSRSQSFTATQAQLHPERATTTLSRIKHVIEQQPSITSIPCFYVTNTTVNGMA